MKMTAWGCIALFLILLCSEQAQASRIEPWISDNGEWMMRSTKSGPRYYLYPGESYIRVLLGNDNLGCFLRVGTKSSNTNLLKLSGPLAVRNITDPGSFLKELGRTIGAPGDPRYWRFAFLCKTGGKITISQPPTVSVPVIMTLTYGPFLTKTVPALVIQKAAIRSISASPVRRTYSLGQSVTINVHFSRNKLDGERSPSVRWRMPQGKLCLPTEGSSGPFPFGPVTKWQPSLNFGEEGPLYFIHKLNRSVILCESGQTIVEVSFEENPMTDSTVKRLVFNVAKRTAPSRRTSQIRSRGIETLPPPVIPDPEPPALPNFELQGEKP
jgi:hypothetical protein